MSLALKSFFGSISLFGSAHLDETKSTRFFGMRIQHDGAVLDFAVAFEESGERDFGEGGSDASDEEVGASVDSAFVVFLEIFHSGVDGLRRTEHRSVKSCNAEMVNIRSIVAIGRAASSALVAAATGRG